MKIYHFKYKKTPRIPPSSLSLQLSGVLFTPPTKQHTMQLQQKQKGKGEGKDDRLTESHNQFRFETPNRAKYFSIVAGRKFNLCVVDSPILVSRLVSWWCQVNNGQPNVILAKTKDIWNEREDPSVLAPSLLLFQCAVHSSIALHCDRHQMVETNFRHCYRTIGTKTIHFSFITTHSIWLLGHISPNSSLSCIFINGNIDTHFKINLITT